MVEQQELTERWSGAAIGRAKWAALSSQIRDAQGPLSSMFRDQGNAIAAAIRKLPPESSARQIEAAVNRALNSVEHLPAVRRSADRLRGSIESALEAGGRAALRDAKVSLRFDLSRDPLAQGFLSSRADAMAEFNRSTRTRLAEILSASAGLTPRQIAAGIRSQYHEWSLSRAATIAETEVSAAYETGRDIVLGELNSGAAYLGISIETRWVTMGDDRVSEGCHENESVGWQPQGGTYPSGHLHPPRHPNCRCSLKSRILKF